MPSSPWSSVLVGALSESATARPSRSVSRPQHILSSPSSSRTSSCSRNGAVRILKRRLYVGRGKRGMHVERRQEPRYPRDGAQAWDKEQLGPPSSGPGPNPVPANSTPARTGASDTSPESPPLDTPKQQAKASDPSNPSAWAAESSKDPERPTSGPKKAQEPVPAQSRLNSLLALGPVLFDPTRAPRNPIVLAHGLYGFSYRGPDAFPRFQLHYWSQVLQILRDRIGCNVIVGKVPGTGTIKQRAEALHKMLESEERVTGGGGRDVNLLAHSMGGLDARYLISHIRPKTYRPVSLTTVCTPHRGSPFMAWCQANIGVGSDLRNDLSAAYAEASGSPRLPTAEPVDNQPPHPPFSLREPILSRSVRDKASKPPLAPSDNSTPSAPKDRPSPSPSNISSYLLSLLDSPAYSNLMPSYLSQHFNPRTPDDPSVRYFSVASCVPKVGIWNPLWLPKVILDASEKLHMQQLEAKGQTDSRWEKGNDGLVTIGSAKWGEYLGTIQHADHWDMRGSAGFMSKPAERSSSGKSSSESSSTQDAGKDSKARWSWQDVNSLVGKLLSLGKGGKVTASSPGSKSPLVAPSATSPDQKVGRDKTSPPAGESRLDSSTVQAATEKEIKSLEDGREGLRDLAEWISDRVPATPMLSLPPPPTLPSSALLPRPAAATDHARLMHGAAPTSSKVGSVDLKPKEAKKEKFDVALLYGALCRNLYDAGF